MEVKLVNFFFMAIVIVAWLVGAGGSFATNKSKTEPTYLELPGMNIHTSASNWPATVGDSGVIWKSSMFRVRAANWVRLKVRIRASKEGAPVNFELLNEQGKTIFEKILSVGKGSEIDFWLPFIQVKEFRFLVRGTRGKRSPRFDVFVDKFLISRVPVNVRSAGAESIVGSASWSAIGVLPGAAGPSDIVKLSDGVVRLKTRVAHCENKDYLDSLHGCTAFRVGEDLFATAWHCMSDRRSNCKTASLEFGYNVRTVDGLIEAKKGFPLPAIVLSIRTRRLTLLYSG